ncbi:hypothetical protein F5Y10DRAFT_70659 [Nemania abortiva]|nr:hypothetical protein F5Y10DRAFT_70659 [Nemania abortiva]
MSNSEVRSSRGPTAPAQCYDTCNNANLEAQSVGKNPALCAADSTFQTYYEACVVCVETYSSSDATRDYLDPTFGQWNAYCDELETSSGSTQSTPSATVTETPIPTPVGYNTVVVTIPYTATINGLGTVWSLEKTLTTFAPLPETTVITIKTSEDGHETVWAFTKTFTALSKTSLVTTTRTTSSSTPNISKTSTPNPTDVMVSEDTQGSQVWIAGPVIGGVSGVAIVLLAVWLLLRARGNRRRSHEVHGDSAFKSELEAKLQLPELDGQGLGVRPVELPSNNSLNR